MTANDVRAEREKEKRVPEAKRVSISERGRERLHASERGASFNSGASYDANGRAKQSSKHGTHTYTQSHAEGGKTAEQHRPERMLREQNLHRAAADTHTVSHIQAHAYCVETRRE